MRAWTFDKNKARWGEGPWIDEPDKVQWVDEATGFDCLAVRHPQSGHWCGYVGVPKGHPSFEEHYDRVQAEVHGGLTYSDFCEETRRETGICHIPEPGRPERVWWLGFDCAHFMDLSPSMLSYGLANRGETYRDLAYVQAECAQLAAQFKEAADARDR